MASLPLGSVSLYGAVVADTLSGSSSERAWSKDIFITSVYMFMYTVKRSRGGVEVSIEIYLHVATLTLGLHAEQMWFAVTAATDPLPSTLLGSLGRCPWLSAFKVVSSDTAAGPGSSSLSAILFPG